MISFLDSGDDGSKGDLKVLEDKSGNLFFMTCNILVLYILSIIRNFCLLDFVLIV